MTRSLCLLVAVASVASAAPVPKAKVDPIDLRSLHERIAQAVKRDDWSDADAKVVEEKVTALLARMTKAADAEDCKLPVAFKGLEKKAIGQVKAVARNALIVGENVDLASCSNCVIVASGAVIVTKLSNCVVVARTVICTLADNSVVVTDEHARATQWSGCAVVAGQRIRATDIDGGLFHVLAPDFTCNVGDADADPKDLRPVLLTVASQATFLVDTTAAAMGGKDCKRVLLKATLAK